MLPSQRELVRLPWARGEIALIRGDAAAAASELVAAAAMLPRHGEILGPPPRHPLLWYSAALACARAGRDAEALEFIDYLQQGYERTFDLEAYVRSFYLLGQIQERRGDAARARAADAKFVDFWRGGDLARDWVADAQKRLASLPPR
jgi:hypothetical protein